jgi:hypothetical protein
LVESEIQLGKKTRQSLSEFMNAYMKKHREVFEKKGEEISEALEEFVNAGTNKKRESLANLIARKYSNLITEIGMVHAFRRHLNDEQSIHPTVAYWRAALGVGRRYCRGFGRAKDPFAESIVDGALSEGLGAGWRRRS